MTTVTIDPINSVVTVKTTTQTITIDAKNEAVNIQGASTADCYIRLADLTGTNKTAQFRQYKYCDAGVEKIFWALGTEPEVAS